MNDRTNAGNFTCTAVVDGTYCGSEIYKGMPYGPINIPLCEAHAAAHFTFYAQLYRSDLIEELEKVGPLNHTPGFTYIIELPNGRIKIGTSTDTRTLLLRWRNISTQYQRKGYMECIKPIAVLNGGDSLEASLHNRFKALRIPDEFGEQFRADPELISFAQTEGIPESLANLTEAYEDWREKRVQYKKAMVEAEARDLVWAF